MEGEIQNEKFVPCLPMLKEGNNDVTLRQTATSVATRLKSCKKTLDKPFMGRLPSIEGEDCVHVDYSPVDKTNELLLGGISCTSDCWDQSTGCNDERMFRRIKGDVSEHMMSVQIKPPEYASPPDDSIDCVVCRWLQAGPCAKEYTEWDAAMKEFMDDENDEKKKSLFFATATIMSKCVRQHEYYDIYAAFL